MNTDNRVFEGRNIQAALDSASRNLGIPLSALRYEVISYGSTGIFGIVGLKKARIRVIDPESEHAETALPKEVCTETMDAHEVVQLFPQEEAPTSPNSTPDLPINEWKAFLEQIASALVENPRVEIARTDKRLVFHIDAQGCEHLIGKKGQTLNAILHVLRKYVQKSDPSLRIFIDVNHYEKRKTDQLTQLTQKIIQKVVNHGRPITIGALSSQERDIVFNLIQQEPQITAQTIGNGSIRKVVISRIDGESSKIGTS
ncbi:protein jag [Desulfatirhabdium butyrativorans]|uniref:Jag family protein n=1 Tax=Desulfatirhabdium butyrativorans TaxID=340467 RepID=UPI0004179AED|nr:Jag N-terminal domain-containing protein [Desulfatirhabdium butyrativorans]